MHICGTTNILSTSTIAVRLRISKVVNLYKNAMQIEKFEQRTLMRELRSCFDEESLEKLARQTNFIQRS
ncbi:MAG: hypothetical protein ACI9XO_001139 [Paraglaciecola sp.]